MTIREYRKPSDKPQYRPGQVNQGAKHKMENLQIPDTWIERLLNQVFR